MVKKKTEEKDQRTRYSDVDLQEFKELILNKLKLAKDEFHKMQKSLQNPNENGDENTSNQYMTLEDGASTFEKENLNRNWSGGKKLILPFPSVWIQSYGKKEGR